MRNFNQTVLMGRIIIKKSFIIWGILVVALSLISCEKEENVVGEDLMGTWYMPQPLNHRTARRSVEDVGRHSLRQLEQFWPRVDRSKCPRFHK